MIYRFLILGCLLPAVVSGCWHEPRTRTLEAELYDRHAVLSAPCVETCEGSAVCFEGACRSRDEVVQLTAGDGFTCALRAEGTVWCWGSNADRTLGQPASITASSEPLEVPQLTGVVQVASGYAHSCAVVRSGAVKCWGLNHNGQLGHGTTQSPVATPVPVAALEDAVHVSVGAFHSCALTRRGSVSCWGVGQQGQLGQGSLSSHDRPVPVLGIDNAVSLHAGESSTCSLLASGEVRCWGQVLEALAPFPHTPVTLGFAEDVVELDVGGGGVCYRQSDGDAHCWQALSDGEPVLAEVKRLNGVRSPRRLQLSQTFGCAINEDRSVSCWGLNTDGQLGDGTTLTREEPVSVSGLADAQELACGASHTCARLHDGSVRCWGGNRQGQLGDGTTYFHTVPVAVQGL